VELLARERDVDRMTDYVWPYGGAYDIYRNPLDMSHISQVTLYLNDLPAGGSVDVTVSPVMALPTQSALLNNPALTVNGQTLTLPFTLASGDFAELEPGGLCTHYNDKGDPLARTRCGTGVPPVVSSPGNMGETPMLHSGTNALTFACIPPSNVSARAEVTLSAFGAPFGTANPHRAINWSHLEREYEMTRLINAPDSPDNAWDIGVRPNEKAKLEIGLCGAMESPVLTVGGHAVRFPVTLTSGQRLLCRDGRHWTVLDSKRTTIAEGTLDAKVPSLRSGTTRVAFTCTSPDRAQVKLVKVYE